VKLDIANRVERKQAKQEEHDTTAKAVETLCTSEITAMVVNGYPGRSLN